jgi:hypothetical protein
MKKNVFQNRKKKIEDLTVQVRAMKRVLWAIVQQEGGKYTIRPDIFEEAHQINASFDAKILDNGAFEMVNTIFTGIVDDEFDQGGEDMDMMEDE